MVLKKRVTAGFITVVLTGCLFTGCGKNQDGLSKEVISGYEHSFFNSLQGDDNTVLTYDEEGYVLTDDYVYVRNDSAVLKGSPDASAENIATKVFGDKLYRTGYKDGWMRVYEDNMTMYINESMVTTLTIDTESDFTYSIAALNITDTSRQFYSYDDLCGDLNEIREQFSDVTHVNVIGSSADKRNIYEIVIGNPEAEKSLLIVGGMSGCEYMTGLFSVKLAEYYAHYAKEGLKGGYKYSELLDKCSIHIIPMLNPDGVAISQYNMDAVNNKTYADAINSWFQRDQSSGGINLSLDNYLMFYSANVKGVELAKNFPKDWSDASSAAAPANKGYKGSEPASENETKALIDLIDDLNPEMVINLRTTGNSVQYNFSGDADVLAKSKAFAEKAASILTYSLDNSDLTTSMNGSLEEYALSKGIPALRVNIGNGDAPLSLNEYNSIWNSGRELPAGMIIELVNN